MPTAYSIDQEIVFQIQKTAFLMEKIADQKLRDRLQLPFSQFRLLMALHYLKTISQRRVALYHGITEAAVSRQVETLIERRFVTRIANPASRRERLLTLTPTGQTLIRRAISLLGVSWAKHLDSLSAERKAQLRQSLNVIITDMCSRAFPHEPARSSKLKRSLA